MVERKVRILGIQPDHPGRGEPSRIVANVALDYIKGEPVVPLVLSVEDALALSEQALHAARVIMRTNR